MRKCVKLLAVILILCNVFGCDSSSPEQVQENKKEISGALMFEDKQMIGMGQPEVQEQFEQLGTELVSDGRPGRYSISAPVEISGENFHEILQFDITGEMLSTIGYEYSEAPSSEKFVNLMSNVKDSLVELYGDPVTPSNAHTIDDLLGEENLFPMKSDELKLYTETWAIDDPVPQCFDASLLDDTYGIPYYYVKVEVQIYMTADSSYATVCYGVAIGYDTKWS